MSLLRDRLIPAVGSTPTIIYSPFMEGTSGVKKTKEGNSLLWGCFLVGAPFGPRGSVAWVPALGLRLRWVRACYAPTTPQQQHNNTTPTPTPYSTSTRSRLLYTPTFLPTSRQTYWVTTTSMADEARPASPGEAILASLPVGPRACLISYHESPSYSLHKKGE